MWNLEALFISFELGIFDFFKNNDSTFSIQIQIQSYVQVRLIINFTLINITKLDHFVNSNLHTCHVFLKITTYQTKY